MIGSENEYKSGFANIFVSVLKNVFVFLVHSIKKSGLIFYGFVYYILWI